MCEKSSISKILIWNNGFLLSISEICDNRISYFWYKLIRCPFSLSLKLLLQTCVTYVLETRIPPEKRQKTKCFLTFSEGTEMEHWAKMSQSMKWLNDYMKLHKMFDELKVVNYFKETKGLKC